MEVCRPQTAAHVGNPHCSALQAMSLEEALELETYAACGVGGQSLGCTCLEDKV